jgi:hypothetical protein
MWGFDLMYKARFCYFDTKTRTVCCKSEKQAIAELDVQFSPDGPIIIDDSVFDEPVHSFDLSKELSKVDPKVFSNNTLEIHLWTDTDSVVDIMIDVKPQYWKRRRKVPAYWDAK